MFLGYDSEEELLTGLSWTEGLQVVRPRQAEAQGMESLNLAVGESKKLTSYVLPHTQRSIRLLVLILPVNSDEHCISTEWCL